MRVRAERGGRTAHGGEEQATGVGRPEEVAGVGGDAGVFTLWWWEG